MRGNTWRSFRKRFELSVQLEITGPKKYLASFRDPKKLRLYAVASTGGVQAESPTLE